MALHALSGSDRQPMPGAHALGPADPTERLEVSVMLRGRADPDLRDRMNRLAAGDPSVGHMTREEFADRYAADSADIATVKAFAATHGLAVVQESAARHTIILSGTVAQFNQAFGVDLQKYEWDGGSYRGRTGPLHIPDELKGAVAAVLGLDNRPAAAPHFRSRPQPGNVHWHASAAAATSFTPVQLASLYDLPPGSGRGQCVAIIELGGGYRPADLKAYFTRLGIHPAPHVSAQSVDQARNAPTGDPNGPDGEVMLDIEVVGAIAPAARIVVYFAPNTDAGFLDAVTTALHDTANNPSVISISWGGPESSWTQQSMTAFDQAFQAAAAMGVTVCVASGDNGSSDGLTDGNDHVDFPASSPYALACGGTRVQADTNAIEAETVWNDGPGGGAGGGGVSGFFPLPAWQNGLLVAKVAGGAQPLTMRGVPDISGDADPQTGYQIRVDGTDTVIGGTSAVAPLWAGLIARINEAKGSPAGLIHPVLYGGKATLNDITQGNNGTFAASQGWDACTGLGSPRGTTVAAAVIG